MKPKRIQLRRTKGWRMPVGAVKVARPTLWGNQFRVGDKLTIAATGMPVTITQGLAVELFRAKVVEVLDGPECGARAHLVEAIERLRGHDLACWCAPDAPCHADVLLRLANA